MNFRALQSSQFFDRFSSTPLGMSLLLATFSAITPSTPAIALEDVTQPSMTSIAPGVAAITPISVDELQPQKSDDLATPDFPAIATDVVATANSSASSEKLTSETLPLVKAAFLPDWRSQKLADVRPTQRPTLVAQVSGNTGSFLTGQVTSVSQLSDVQPTDWAFQALQSLVERYGVIAGYPDGTYKGNRALTRYEFAAGLNAALNRVEELITAGNAGLVSKEDLATLQKLQEQFAAELATLRGRVDSLEARTTTLERQQFSTTTKLQGEIIVVAADTFGDRANNTPADDTGDDTETFLAYRARIGLLTSFTGKDQLLVRLAANNVPNLTTSTGTAMTRITFDKGSFPDGDLFLDALNYRFPVGSKANVWIGLRQLQPVNYASNSNPVVGGASGAVSRFSTHNPTIFRPGFDGAGAAFAYQFSKKLRLSLGYTVDDTQANVPESGRGIFSGNNLAFAQLTFNPLPNLETALSYGRKYFGSNTGFNLTGGTGSAFARNPFQQNATVSDNFGVQFNWRVTPRFQLGGWFGYTEAHQVRGGDSDATILNGAITLAFPDLFAKGNVGGFVIGVPPKVTDSNYRPRAGAATREDPDTSLHLEAFYTFRVRNGITITPDVYVITNPEHNDDNDLIWVGAIRTTFSF